jgi:hypothetical protein
MKDIGHSKLWNSLMDGVYGPRKGGARIIVDAENAATGAGKTGLAVGFAHAISKAFGYDLTREDLTLSGQEYLGRWREHPDKEQPSVLVLDELSGAGAGDNRRSMSSQNVNLGRSWQLMRKKRIVTITTIPHWSDADKKMRRFADYRLWCKEQPIGYFVPYKVGATFDDGGVRTRSMGDGRIKFPNLDAHGDQLYRYLGKKKDELMESEYFDADALLDENAEENMDPDEARREEKLKVAQRMRDNGMSTTEIGEHLGMSQSWVSQYTDAPAQPAD